MVLCVTGPMAAGKNAAQEILESRGFIAVDADRLVHDAVESQKERILSEFRSDADEAGISLLRDDGSIDRRALGSIVFTSARNTKRQEDIVYPEVNARFDALIRGNPGRDIAINATVLYKVPAIAQVDSVLFIDAPWCIRLKRARARDGRTVTDILRRFRAQRNLFAKYRLAVADTRRVWNIGTRHRLEKKIDEFLASRR